MKRNLTIIVGMMALTLVLYVLSAGPVCSISINQAQEAILQENPGEITPTMMNNALRKFVAIDAFYLPLGWLANRSRTFKGAFDVYLEVWLPAHSAFGPSPLQPLQPKLLRGYDWEE